MHIKNQTLLGTLPPLLAKKPLCAWTPEEYVTYVRSLYKEPKKKPGKSTGISFRLSSKGNPIITCTRKVKYLTRAEVKQIADALKFTQAQIWNYAKAKNFTITNTAEEAKTLTENLEEIPW